MTTWNRRADLLQTSRKHNNGMKKIDDLEISRKGQGQMTTCDSIYLGLEELGRTGRRRKKTSLIFTVVSEGLFEQQRSTKRGKETQQTSNVLNDV